MLTYIRKRFGIIPANYKTSGIDVSPILTANRNKRFGHEQVIRTK